jgi:hypothetical protein
MKPKLIPGIVRGNWRCIGAAVAGILLALVNPAQAQTNSWIITVSHFWDVPTDWSLGVAPSNNQAAILITNTVTGASNKTINLDSGTPIGTMTISNLSLSAPAGLTNTLSLNSVGAKPLRILNAFTISTGGGLFATNSTVIVEGVSTGRLRIEGGVSLVGGASLVVTSSALNTVIGNAGNGSLTVSSGATAVFSGLAIGSASCTSTGVVTVAGGSLFVTNSSGTATLEIRGGTLTFSAGVVKADRLVITNDCGRFIHTGGLLTIGTVTLDPNLSAVGDGIPNGWKQQYGLDPFDPNLGSEDPDGDGMSNLQEYLGGSNPVADIKAITKEGSSIRVIWQAAAAKTNALQRAPGGNYDTNNFADIFIVTNNIGSVTNYLDGGAATNFSSRFYRVRLVP